MRNMLEYDECPADGFTVLVTRVGRLDGAEGALDLLYWMHLTTVVSNADTDVSVLKRLASSLRMIRWE